MCPKDPSRLVTSFALRFVGLAMVIGGLVIAVWALIQLKALENTKHLITTGLYSRLRHPMYYGFILWILGWGIHLGATVSLIAGFVGIGFILYWRHLEEVRLMTRFGDDYRRYCAKTLF